MAKTKKDNDSGICVPLEYFAQYPQLTAWEILAIFIHDETDISMVKGAEIIGKGVDNLRKTYYAAKAKV
jgi:hypothetical protein